MNQFNKDIYICHMIVADNKARKAEEIYHQNKSAFVVTQPCQGTVSDTILNALGINSSARSFLVGMIGKKKIDKFINEARQTLRLDEPGKGILFIKKVRHVYLADAVCESESEDEKMSNEVLITVITNYGMTSELIDVARENGARGATILKGHGTVSEDAQTFFGVRIEPEKEVVIMIVNKDIEKQVMEAIHKAGNFEKASNGIVFSQEISHSLGISS